VVPPTTITTTTTTTITTIATTTTTTTTTSKTVRLFGRWMKHVIVPDETKHVYKIVQRTTDGLAEGSSGPIYGENTECSMQRLFNRLGEIAEFSQQSRFLDVGSGRGKPSLHAMVFPGVEFSAGVEVEFNRYLVSLAGLKAVLSSSNVADEKFKCVFILGDIASAGTFDGFTHIYMFSIGFPPTLWRHLFEMWKNSSCKYLICYETNHNLQQYGFELEELDSLSMNMFGGAETRKVHIYRRIVTNGARMVDAATLPFDPLFQQAWAGVCRGRGPYTNSVNERYEAATSHRSSRRRAARPLPLN
jgi:hypothetical protein